MGIRKKLKEKLKAGQVVTSIMLRFPDPSLAEMLAIQGVELVVIDNEHYAFDAQNMQNIVDMYNDTYNASK